MTDIFTIKEDLSGKKVTIAGIVNKIKVLKTKRDELMAILQIEDITSDIEVVVFPKNYHFVQNLSADMIVIIKGVVDDTNDNFKILVDEIIPFDKVQKINFIGCCLKFLEL